MRDPKALFPFLFASSWLGNLILTILAFYLAFTHTEPLTPLLFTTVALCILSGNILPILVYAITIKFRRIELEAESTEVSWRVQEGLKRSEDVMNRLDEAEGSLAKSVLVARQVPERIREALVDVQELAEKVNTLEIQSFTEAIREQAESVLSVKQAMEAMKGSLEDLARALSTAEADLALIGKDVKGISRAQTQVVESVTDKSRGRRKDELEVSVSERLDLVFESLESVQDSLDGLLQRIAGMGSAGPELDGGGDGDSDTDTDSDSDGDPDGDSDSDSDLDGDPDGDLDLDDETVEEFVLTDGRTRLIAHAMIGMHNKLYIRGDQPWLSWEDGQQMELIGIGEFAWSIDNLKEPIEVTVLLNDEYAAEQGAVTLHPGKTVRMNPTFPRL